MSERDFVAVVVAGGGSTRFGGSVPKQFVDLGGRSILERSVRAVAADPAVRGVVVVLPADAHRGERGALVSGWDGVLSVAAGGQTRADSVAAGLEEAADAEFVLVHDAARPLVEPGLVRAVIEATRAHGAAIPALPVADTVKRVDASGAVDATLERSHLRLAQTPQGARRSWLSEALKLAAARGVPVTDEAQALELAGHPVACVAGDPRNRKITTVEDLEAARRLLQPQENDLRVGSGFDVHRLGSDRILLLGGVRFPGEVGLIGHSDADVVLHAAMDALLGAAALGDIGCLFPPEDPRFKDADSVVLAGDVADRLEQAGYLIVNLDMTLLAERPKIRPHHEAMRRSIAGAFRIGIDRVGLKATTLEKLGALGREEGIACEAVALIRRRTERS